MGSLLHQLSLIVWTKDLNETISFYVNALGFKSRSNFPNFASFQRDEVQIMAIVPTDDREDCDTTEAFFPKPIFTGSIYVFMQSVDELWEEIKNKVKVKSAIADREYMMRDFSILDNNGYELVFGEDISGRKDK